MNTLFYGDCLTIMQQEMKLNSVDLIYLDPPFNSNQVYNAIYKDETGRPLPSKIEAFCDIWTLDAEREKAIRNMPVLMRESGIEDETVEFWRLWMKALRLTQPRLLAYLSYMVQRLAIMKGLLRPTGSIYLHCDPTASHYIKVMMDGIFGHENFKNEIIWRRYGSHNDSKKFGRVHDSLLYYGNKFATWNPVQVPLSKESVKSRYTYEDEVGLFTTSPLQARSLSGGGYEYSWRGISDTWKFPSHRLEELDNCNLIYWPAKGKIPRRKVYLKDSKGIPVPDVWDDIKSLAGNHKERLGYPTQKPLALLERIIKASTDEGDVVFDPFCGSASTIEAAHKLNRRWIGIDIAIHAIKRVSSVRLKDKCKLRIGKDFEIKGVPL